MDTKVACISFLTGLRDSFKGIYTLFILDHELQKRRKSHTPTTHTQSPARIKKSSSRESTPQLIDKSKREENKSVMKILLYSTGAGIVVILFYLAIEYLLSFGANFAANSKLLTDIIGRSTLEILGHGLRGIFHIFFTIPICIISKFFYGLWFQDISQTAFRYSRGRRTATFGFSRFIADYLFSMIIQVLFILQVQLSSYLIPYKSLMLIMRFVQMSILYSLYAFEYKWFEMGWEIHKRLFCIERNWPYFIGFGLPLTFATELIESWVISNFVFCILFPCIIISATESSHVTGSWPHIRIFYFVIMAANFIGNLFEFTRSKEPSAR